MYARSRNTARGMPNPVCVNQTAGNVPTRLNTPNRFSSGMNATCIGITSRPTTMMNVTSRPGKSMKVNAYAAIAAIRIGMTTAGTVTTRVLMNALPMPLARTSW